MDKVLAVFWLTPTIWPNYHKIYLKITKILIILGFLEKKFATPNVQHNRFLSEPEFEFPE
jgi:hypothetical protein